MDISTFGAAVVETKPAQVVVTPMPAPATNSHPPGIAITTVSAFG